MGIEQRVSLESVIKGILYKEDGSFGHTSTTQQIVDNYAPRTDRKGPQEMYGGLLQEGSRLHATRIVHLSDGKKIHLVSTVAKSPHTPIRVPYNAFDTSWKSHNPSEQFNQALVPIGFEGEMEVTQPYAPLHMIVWGFVENSDGSFISLDPNDMSACSHPEEDISISKNDIRQKFALIMGEDKMNEFFLNLLEMVGTSQEVLLDLYNNTFRSRFYLGFKEKTGEDILQGFAYGYGGGDASKGLTQGMGEGGDGTGRGPMSAPTFHYHVCIHLSQEELDEINKLSPDYSYNDIISDLRSDPDYFGRDVRQVMLSPIRFTGNEKLKTESGVLQTLLESIDVYELLKSGDMNATWIFQVFQKSGWIKNKAQAFFNDPSISVGTFIHHESTSAREFSAVEGLELKKIPESARGRHDTKAEMYTKIVRFIREEIAPLWNDVRIYTQDKLIMTQEERDKTMSQMGSRYDLPEDILAEIARIKPTEKQLKALFGRDIDESQKSRVNSELIEYSLKRKKWTMQFHKHYEAIMSGNGSYADLELVLSSLQKLQLYDTPWNKGQNIPGVPGIVITHNRTSEGGYIFLIGLVVSQKGLMEVWTGGTVVRS